MGGKNGVVGLDDGARELGRGVDAELELRLLTVVSGELLKEERSKAGTSSSTEGVEDKEALETRAVVCESPQLIHDGVDELLSDSVVTTRI